MSDKEPGHIRKMLLEPGLGTRHVQCIDLAREKADGLDMSGPGTGYVRGMPLEPG
jgi:hypothetical protein